MADHRQQCNTIFIICGITILATLSIYGAIAITCSFVHGPIKTVDVETGSYTETYGEPYYENGTKKCNITMTPETTRELEDCFWTDLTCFSSLLCWLVIGVAFLVMILSLDNIRTTVPLVSEPKRRRHTYRTPRRR